jgi:hypothetical protein
MSPERPHTESRVFGVIVDTNSKGRFDLIVYTDGILAVPGTYVGVALRAGGAGMGGAGGGSPASAGVIAGTGAAIGAAGGRTYETGRLAKTLARPRSEVLEAEPKSFFVDRGKIVGLVLRKRWYGCSLAVKTQDQPDGRKFEWKPALNNFSNVRNAVEEAFGDLVSEE